MVDKFKKIYIIEEILNGVGVVIPGLIANCYYKQGIKLTVASSLGVSLAVYAIITFVPGI